MSGRFWGRWTAEISSLCEQCSEKAVFLTKYKKLAGTTKRCTHACLEMHVTVVRIPEVDVGKVKGDGGENEGDLE